MDKSAFHWVLWLFLLLVMPAVVVAEEMQSEDVSDGTEQTQDAPAYTQAELDQMLAPIALYPDPLVTQILMAATYPFEVAEAARWLQDPQNAALTGAQLFNAMQQQPWDPSVKSLVPFPQILQMMNQNIEWTEKLGDAFLANQPGTMDTVQQLRKLAMAAGSLNSTSHQIVSTQNDIIQIQPAESDKIYVPSYNPGEAYGEWPYPDNEPVYFPPSADIDHDEGVVGFGFSTTIVAPLWNWNHTDWHTHNITIDNERIKIINKNHPPQASGVWKHDPVHRNGVPYRSERLNAKFRPANPAANRSYRGYSVVAQPVQRIPMRVRTEQRPPAPVFESFPQGADVRIHAARGAASVSSSSLHPRH